LSAHFVFGTRLTQQPPLARLPSLRKRSISVHREVSHIQHGASSSERTLFGSGGEIMALTGTGVCAVSDPQEAGHRRSVVSLYNHTSMQAASLAPKVQIAAHNAIIQSPKGQTMKTELTPGLTHLADILQAMALAARRPCYAYSLWASSLSTTAAKAHRTRTQCLQRPSCAQRVPSYHLRELRRRD